LTWACDDRDWVKEVELVRMTPADLDEVMVIERHSFPSAWSRGSYERELRNANSCYFTAKHDGAVVGYIGMWIIADDAHITTLAVHPRRRRAGLATRLIQHLMDFARNLGAVRITLEVREGNRAAQALYHKFGFEDRGRLRRYYGDTGEDGLVMWKRLSSEGSGESAH
jgi:ribosomal-protein-alanine N-acetyltransferase